MGSKLNPYIGFNGNARQAMEFYKEVFGGTLRINTFAEYGQSGPDADKVMHSQLETDNGFTLMASDAPEGMPTQAPGGNITVSLSGEDADEMRGYWDKLADGGTVTMPFEKQMWGDQFGMVTDRFGTPWMIDAVAEQQG